MSLFLLCQIMIPLRSDVIAKLKGVEVSEAVMYAKLGFIEQLFQQLLPSLVFLFSRSNHLCMQLFQ